MDNQKKITVFGATGKIGKELLYFYPGQMFRPLR
jgi:hypothetical protein